MTELSTDKELYTYLIHDVRALDSTVRSRLVRINDSIRRINKQPYIHKQVNCLENFKECRKVADKLISKIDALLSQCVVGKASSGMLDLAAHNSTYRSLKQEYFKLE